METEPKVSELAPFKWFYEEDFWRDIAKNAVTALIVGGGAIIVANAAGWVRDEPAQRVADFAYVGVLVGTFLWGVVVFQRVRAWSDRTGAPKRQRYVGYVSSVLIMLGVPILTWLFSLYH